MGAEAEEEEEEKKKNESISTTLRREESTGQQGRDTGTSKRVVLPNGKKGAYIMIEYILLHGVNDTPEVVEQLAELLAPFRLHVKLNLIPYNPIFNPQGLAKVCMPPLA